MIACNRWHDSLLDASLDELRGTGSSPLATHVRSCTGCGGAARTLLEATATLHADLGSPSPPSAATVDDLLARAGLRSHPVRGRRLWPRLGAAAAAVLALLSLPSRETPVAFRTPTTEVSPAPMLEEGDGNAAILPTRNPDITVIWFF
jgi:hypothetical protein